MTVHNGEDIFLFQRFVNGDKEGMEILYRKYFNLMLNYGLKIAPDRNLVKDSIQDVFMNTFNNKRIKTANVVSPRAYLLKSLRNSLFDKLNRHRKFREIEEMDFGIPVDDAMISEFLVMDDEQKNLSRKTIHIISKLNANRKTALYLKYIKDLSHREIAEILNISEQASMNLISRALASIREKLLH